MANLTKASAIALCILLEAGGTMPLSQLFPKLRTQAECDYDAAIEALDALYEHGEIGYDFDVPTAMPLAYVKDKRPALPQDIEGLAVLLGLAFDFYLQDNNKALVRIHQLEEFMVPLRAVAEHFEELRTLLERHGFALSVCPDGFLVNRTHHPPVR
ncbi:MAG TPA: hypothetical protein VKV18_01080 [Chthonomonas sp.]|uniref:hypothetical protein n=1 Tax=Chthonomonas sp. TaxID=2282153 RepID=UPI002B4B7006|nr:hypothetical protein [Chthonomonas sp.]HLI47272.1 hypothetical protein [Chthonomonas sp.]